MRGAERARLASLGRPFSVGEVERGTEQRHGDHSEVRPQWLVLHQCSEAGQSEKGSQDWPDAADRGSKCSNDSGCQPGFGEGFLVAHDLELIPLGGYKFLVRACTAHPTREWGKQTACV